MDHTSRIILILLFTLVMCNLLCPSGKVFADDVVEQTKSTDLNKIDNFGLHRRNLRSLHRQRIGINGGVQSKYIYRNPRYPFDNDLYGKDDDSIETNKRFDDYGHMRFGKRNEDQFDDYGHLRFGRSLDF